jgi:flavin reductase (DIM6/NTAB) family NADH-FMN oxidoreductase RutF
VCFECATVQVIRTDPGEPASGNLVIGRVLWVHVDDAMINERLHVDADQLRAIGRMGGSEYCRTRDRFAMPRGKEALKGD